MITLLASLFYIGLFAMGIAAAVAAMFYVAARLATRGVTEGRRQFLIAAVMLPFLSVLWIGLVTLGDISGSLNDENEVLHLDLPGGYAFTAEKGEEKGNIAGPDGAVRVVDIRRIQVTGAYVFGTRFLEDQMVRMREWYPDGLAGTHLILDTRSGAERWLEEKAFDREAQALGAQPTLRSIAELGRSDAPSGPDMFAIILAFGVPAAALLLLIRRGIHLRRRLPA